jgi:hypothetical protein
MAVKSRVYIRDTLGRFARVTRGRRATRSLGRRSSRSGRKANSLSGGGSIGGVPASQAARKARTSAADDVVEGSKLRRGR